MTAIRLTFSVVDGKPEFISAKSVNMRVPPARNLDQIDSAAGTWIEILSKDKQRVHAAVVDADILSPMIEVRTGVGDPGLTMVKSKATQVLHVVIPANRNAAGFRLMRRDKPGARTKTILSGDI